MYRGIAVPIHPNAKRSISMNIYLQPRSYRQIYKEYYGLIPKDTNGRTFEIHHIDGNHSNNEPGNLIALSIQGHYNIHFLRGDWNACQAILVRMNKTPDEISNLCSQLQKNRFQDGTHPWNSPLHGEKSRERCLEQVKNGTHPWLNSNHQREHALLRAKEGTLPAQEAAINGTHNFFGGEMQRKTQLERVKNGTHHCLGPYQNLKKLENGNHPSQTKVSCLRCKKIISIGNFSRHLSGLHCQLSK